MQYNIILTEILKPQVVTQFHQTKMRQIFKPILVQDLELLLNLSPALKIKGTLYIRKYLIFEPNLF